MTSRSRHWTVGLEEDLRDPVLAPEFLIASIAEGVSLQLALGHVIRALGVKEFAMNVKMSVPAVRGAINPRHNPAQDTINLLVPFGLRLTVPQIAAPATTMTAASRPTAFQNPASQGSERWPAAILPATLGTEETECRSRAMMHGRHLSSGPASGRPIW